MKTVKSFSFLASAMLLLAGGLLSPAEALLADHECLFCHAFHGGPGFSLLTAETSELVCLSCHTVSINDTAAAEVHNPLGLASNQSGYITCRECHDAHSNQGANVKLVGYKKDGENFFEPVTPPAIRKELPGTVGLTYNVVTFTGSTDFNIPSSNIGVCEVCHDPNHNAGVDCTVCHGHSGGFLPTGGGSCVGCHDGTDTDAPVVTYNSAHSGNQMLASVGIQFTCENCHTAHQEGNVQIPNNSAVGIVYDSAGHNGISLGADDGNPNDAVGTTEADICWNCHDNFNPVVSEWGTNSGSSYDYGSLHSGVGDTTPSPGNHLNWTTGYWKSAGFTYKNGPLNTRPVSGNANPGSNVAGRGTASIHATGGTVGTQSNALGDISCSYCHDVHELNVLDTDLSSGKPYLRGTWTPNPFPEDGAPNTETIYTADSTDSRGLVPRGGVSAYNAQGGWQIEQNNGLFTESGFGNFAGLCQTCHSALSLNDAWTGHGAVVPFVAGDSAGTITRTNIFDQDNRMKSNPSVTFTGTVAVTRSRVAGTWYNIFTLTGSRKLAAFAYPYITITNATGYDGTYAVDRADTNGTPGADSHIYVPDQGLAAGSVSMTITATDASGVAIDPKGTWTYGTPIHAGVEDLRGAYGDSSTGWQGDLRNNDEWTDGILPVAPRNASTTLPSHAFTYGPVTTLDLFGDTAQSNFHRFPCSKCHSPHASRLPRLMITNCLNVEVNSWDDSYDPSSWLSGGTPYAAKELAYSPTANNCHRYVRSDDPNRENVMEAGWNAVTPW